MAKPADAGQGIATAGSLGAAEDIRDHATFGILKGTFASGIFPVGHGEITRDFVQDPSSDALASPVTASSDIWF